jgi:hypothetical protein
VSQHLKAPKAAGLVTVRRTSSRSIYQLDPDGVAHSAAGVKLRKLRSFFSRLGPHGRSALASPRLAVLLYERPQGLLGAAGQRFAMGQQQQLEVEL